MTTWTTTRLLTTCGLSLLVWLVLAAICLTLGPTTAPLTIPTHEQFMLRLEPVLLASLIGAALAASGVAYQAILQNPLAEPYLLGVSTGASLAAYLWRFPFASGWAVALLGATGGALSQQTFAFAGALVAISVVFLIAGNRGRLEPLTLVLVGVIVNAIIGSLFLLFNAIFRELPGSGGMLTFLVGGIQTSLLPAQIIAAGGVIAIGWGILLWMSGQLTVATLSESEARALGVHVQRLRWTALIVASLMAASAVAISGPIGFVGLICPHLGRLMVGNDQRRLLPVATALGAGLLALADATSRTLAGTAGVQTLLPVGVLTGLLGGPFFLLLLWQRRMKPSLR